jgi:hypothetical protein
VGQAIFNYFQSLSSPIFPAFIALFYILGKVLLKGSLRPDYDAWDAVAWFFVDISVLLWTVSLTADIPGLFPQQGKVASLSTISALCLVSGFLYSQFLRLRGQDKMFRAGVCIGISFLINAAAFDFVLSGLRARDNVKGGAPHAEALVH